MVTYVAETFVLVTRIYTPLLMYYTNFSADAGSLEECSQVCLMDHDCGGFNYDTTYGHLPLSFFGQFPPCFFVWHENTGSGGITINEAYRRTTIRGLALLEPGPESQVTVGNAKDECRKMTSSRLIDIIPNSGLEKTILSIRKQECMVLDIEKEDQNSPYWKDSQALLIHEDTQNWDPDNFVDGSVFENRLNMCGDFYVHDNVESNVYETATVFCLYDGN